MPANLDSGKIDQLLTEADDLIQQITADISADMEEERCLQLKIRAQQLKQFKSEIECRIEEKKSSGTGGSADGIHEAIQDLGKAITDLKNYLT